MLLALALLAPLSVAHLSPTTSSARLLPAAATEYKAHNVWVPFAVGGVAAVVVGLGTFVTMLLVRGDVWTTAAIGVVGGFAAVVILAVCSAVAIAFAIDNAVHKRARERALQHPAAPPLPESSRTLPQGTVVFRF